MVLKEVLLTTFAFSGLLAGYLLANIAKEEVKQGRKWIRRVKELVSLASGIGLLYFSWSNVTVLATFAVGIIISMFLKKEYFYPGLVVSLSFFLNNDANLFATSIIFIHGCLYGCLVENNKLKTLYVNLGLYLLAFLIIAIEYLAGAYSQVLLTVGIVALSKYVILRRAFKHVK